MITLLQVEHDVICNSGRRFRKNCDRSGGGQRQTKTLLGSIDSNVALFTITGTKSSVSFCKKLHFVVTKFL